MKYLMVPVDVISSISTELSLTGSMDLTLEIRPRGGRLIRVIDLVEGAVKDEQECGESVQELRAGESFCLGTGPR